MTMGLTHQQASAFSFIQERLARSRVAPSIPEIAVGIGLSPKSKSVVSAVLEALEERGLIRRLRRRARAIEIVGRGASRCPHCFNPPGSTACRKAAMASVTYSGPPPIHKHSAASGGG